MGVYHSVKYKYCYQHGHTNSQHWVTVATRFLTVAPNIYGSMEFYVILLVPGSLRWLLYSLEKFVHLCSQDQTAMVTCVQIIVFLIATKQRFICSFWRFGGHGPTFSCNYISENSKIILISYWFMCSFLKHLRKSCFLPRYVFLSVCSYRKARLPAKRFKINYIHEFLTTISLHFPILV
jgi:hypothetical protein